MTTVPNVTDGLQTDGRTAAIPRNAHSARAANLTTSQIQSVY